MALQPQQFQPPMQQQQFQPPMQQQQQPQGWWDWFKNLFSNVGEGAKNFAFGQPGGYQQLPNYHPYQQQMFDQTANNGLQLLQNPYQGFEPIAQQATNQFNQQIVPGLAERFTSMGGFGTGALSSPAFASQLGSAGAGLQSMLAAQQAQFGQTNRQQGLSQLQLGLNNPFQYKEVGAQPGFIENWGPTLAQGATMYATGGLSGAPAAANLIGRGVNYLRGKK